jgi:hypothetical protein
VLVGLAPVSWRGESGITSQILSPYAGGAQAPRRCRRHSVARDEAPDRRGQGSVVTSVQPPPQRHWRSYCTDPLPTAAEALTEPFRAFLGDLLPLHPFARSLVVRHTGEDS